MGISLNEVKAGFRKKLNIKYIRVKESWVFIRAILIVLVLLEVGALGGYRRCLERVGLSSG